MTTVHDVNIQINDLTEKIRLRAKLDQECNSLIASINKALIEESTAIIKQAKDAGKSPVILRGNEGGRIEGWVLKHHPSVHRHEGFILLVTDDWRFFFVERDYNPRSSREESGQIQLLKTGSLDTIRLVWSILNGPDGSS